MLTKEPKPCILPSGLQEAGKGEWAALRIVQMARQLMEECRANKALDARTIAVRT